MRYFFDTNIIIDIFDKQKKALDLLTNIASDEYNEIVINRLVYLESLRTIPTNDTNVYNRAKKTLDSFEKVDITQEIYDKAIEFSRFFKTVKHQSLSGRCEAIDIVHFITAKHYKLTVVSNDEDFDTLEKIYLEFTSA